MSDMDATATSLHQLVHAAQEAYATALEHACEEALTGGVCGVSVVGTLGSGYTFAVDHRVPYGNVWCARTDDAVWLMAQGYDRHDSRG